MSSQEVLEKTHRFVKTQMANNDVGHDYLHVERVLALAKDIGNHEQGSDPFLVEMIALLHDINDHKLCIDENALSAFLDTLPLENSLKEQIVTCTGYISYSKYPKPDPTIPLEARIVQDADRLDAIGAMGIARTFAYTGAKKRPFYGEGKDTAMAHFAEKLCHLSESLNTPRAKEIAVQRQTYLNDFVRQFYGEIDLSK